MKKIIELLKAEFNSYSKNIRTTLYILFFLAAGFMIFGVQILFWGLGYTDMNNIFTMGVWIIGDLGLVALGGGAFTTGFVLYIFRNDKLEPIINSTVLIGFMCYLFTFVFLVFDIGQPLRAWFGYTYPNWGEHLMPTSMLTEVVWCLTFYFLILCVELVPVVLKHKILDAIPLFRYFGHYLHKLMWIFAAAGTFLSFFHQGSLGGGMWGVLYGKPGWFSPHFFFLAIVAATAGGTSFMMLCAYVASKVAKKEVVPATTFYSLAKVSGVMMSFYLIFRIYDIIVMTVKYVPMADRHFIDLFSLPFGIWMLVVEIACAIAAIVFLLIKKFRENEKFFLIGVSCGTTAILMSKLIAVLHGFSVPNFPWKKFMGYFPTFQEWFILFGGLAFMVMIYMWFFKYTPLFSGTAAHEEHH